MKLALDDIFQKLGVKNLNTVIDHGCGETREYVPRVLKTYSQKVIGVDILDKERVSKNLGDYIKVSPEIKNSYFDSIKSDTIDCVFMFSSSGMTPQSNWESYVLDSSGRQGRYFTRQNYPRIIKKGGYLIIIEWESWPEKRFGKRDYRYITANIDKYYPYAEIPNLEMVVQGFSTQYSGPYIVYKKV